MNDADMRGQTFARQADVLTIYRIRNCPRDQARFNGELSFGGGQYTEDAEDRCAPQAKPVDVQESLASFGKGLASCFVSTCCAIEQTISDALDRCRSLNQRTIDELLRRGTPREALWRPLALGTAKIVLFGKRFEFASRWPSAPCQNALIIPALDLSGFCRDLVAWCPATGTLGSWYGRVSMLGTENLVAARLDDSALPVHRTPLEWLQACRWGVVPIDMRQAAPLLRDADPLVAADLCHRTELLKALAVRPTRILVAVREDRGAA